MPQLTGKALAKELKRIRPDIPIILCIGYVLPMTPESRPLTASARISPSQSATRTSEPPFSECSALAPPAALTRSVVFVASHVHCSSIPNG